jgi:exopolysaccharide biosynthesis polyprenyl glycosylphosphotransferase
MDSTNKVHLHKIYDLVVMAGAFVIIALTAQPDGLGVSVDRFLSMRLTVENFVICVAGLCLWHLIFCSFNLYASTRLTTRWSAESFEVLKATTLGTLIIMCAAAVFDITIITPMFLTTFWITVSAITIISRLALRYVQRLIRLSGRNLKYTVIVGTNQRAIAIARKIESREELGYRFVGFVDDCWHGPESSDGQNSLVADLNGVQAYLKDHVVDEVIICAPLKSLYEKVSRVIAQCEEQGITVRFIYDIYTPTIGKVHIDQLDDQHVVTVTVTNKNAQTLFIKRLIDSVGALILLILFAPLFLIISLLIKVTSPGPVFFIQERLGRNKRRFRLYKFRTMVVDAETQLARIEHLNEVTGPVFKIRQDPRITPVGRLLRKISLDELPQLFNVLMGDMSLVGPRPLPVRDYEGFNDHHHCRRLSVRPGMTGLWQVTGRNSIAFDKWMELDLLYIDQWSLWLDLKILLKTIPAVMKGTGAS